jgi:UDP-N-acetylglucosamine--N-acetylmuramyl-(pentapeptide) pyrophosphoryl-undecaprenol N-acetylglucosamine transferase
MAGGTGGHVFPALAVADQLRAHGVPVVWLGTPGGLETRVVPREHFPLFTLDAAGLRGRGWRVWLAAPARLLLSLTRALRLLLRVRPGAVLGMGGFASGAGGLAAWALRIPLLIHEQNALAGLTNRLLYRLARVVLEGFPGAFPVAAGARCVGNPVRAAIAALPEPAARRVAADGVPLRVLVLGGSQGARALNEVLPPALAQAGRTMRVVHQCGAGHDTGTTAAYRAHGHPDARVVPFIDDMAAAYAAADLVVCRAGALTLAELCAAGIGAILVPYPHAADDHQSANARHLSARGAALLLPERELTPAALAQMLRELDGNRARLRAMAAAARAMARPDAARAVAEACMEVLRD